MLRWQFGEKGDETKFLNGASLWTNLQRRQNSPCERSIPRDSEFRRESGIWGKLDVAILGNWSMSIQRATRGRPDSSPPSRETS